MSLAQADHCFNSRQGYQAGQRPPNLADKRNGNAAQWMDELQIPSETRFPWRCFAYVFSARDSTKPWMIRAGRPKTHENQFDQMVDQIEKAMKKLGGGNAASTIWSTMIRWFIIWKTVWSNLFIAKINIPQRAAV